MSMRLIAALACCTLAMGLTACNKSGKSAEAGAMKQCDDKCDGKGECCKDKASMGQVSDKKEGCCDAKAGACAEKGSMGQVSGQGACGSKGSCSSKAGC